MQNVEAGTRFPASREKSLTIGIFSQLLPTPAGFAPTPEETKVSQPPKSTPHSDIEGVHRDEKENVETAAEAGQGAEDLERARRQAVGRPPHTDEGPDREDRSR